MFRESLHKLIAYLNDGNLVAKASPEQKIMRLLEKKGPLTVREVVQFTRFDADIVRRKLEGLVKDGEITISLQGKKLVYFITPEEEPR